MENKAEKIKALEKAADLLWQSFNYDFQANQYVYSNDLCKDCEDKECGICRENCCYDFEIANETFIKACEICDENNVPFCNAVWLARLSWFDEVHISAEEFYNSNCSLRQLIDKHA